MFVRICFLTFLACLFMTTTVRAEPLPQPATGHIERLEKFPSKFVDARNVDVWLPDGYSTLKRYNVLYMHDGQMLFDARTTWNQQAWNIDAAITRLVNAGRIPDTIVVGVWNNPDMRYAEYYPEKFLALAEANARLTYVEQAQHGKPLADAYLRFLVEELKPAIDLKFATRAGRESTYIMGSSMGGLISLYALCEYPQVFAGAAGLSTHWVGHPTAWGLERVRNASMPLAAFRYLDAHLPPPGAHRLYTDRGSVNLEALYVPAQEFVEELFRQRGYTDAQATTRVFEGTQHMEADWSLRLEVPLLFLMGLEKR